MHVLSADSYGSAEDVGATLSAAYLRVHSAAEKVAYVMWLGAESCVAVGNGRNDAPMLSAAALGIAVIGPESAWAGTLQAADIVTRSVQEALRLLNEPTALTAVLRP